MARIFTSVSLRSDDNESRGANIIRFDPKSRNRKAGDAKAPESMTGRKARLQPTLSRRPGQARSRAGASNDGQGRAAMGGDGRAPTPGGMRRYGKAMQKTKKKSVKYWLAYSFQMAALLFAFVMVMRSCSP